MRSRRVGGRRNVYVNSISLEKCSKRCAEVSGRSPEQAWSASQFGAKLHTFTSEIAEGFFGKCVVLVEGVGDKAILEAWYRHLGRDPHAEGIIICEVSGKSKLDKPVAIFGEMQIARYWVFDNDKSDDRKKPQDRVNLNKMLQRLAGRDVGECVEWPDGVHDSFACWDGNVEKYVEGVVGKERFEAVASEMARNFDIQPSTCAKFPASAAAMFRRFCEAGHAFEKLDQIVSAIDKVMTD